MSSCVITPRLGSSPRAWGKGPRTAGARGGGGSSPRAWGKAQTCLNFIFQFRIIPTCVGKRPPSWDSSGASSDHPHVRGEKTDCARLARCFSGSSPRVWGKGACRSHLCQGTRIIPTRVGKRLRPIYRPPSSSDHPHACGEKPPGPDRELHRPGSSPRVWGKESLRLVEPENSRIIPTRVGKRGVLVFSWLKGTDHPHACGEKRHPAGRKPSDLGSSPRVWGKARGV